MSYQGRTNLMWESRKATVPTTSMSRELNALADGAVPMSLGIDKTAEQMKKQVGLALAPPHRYRSILVPVSGDAFAEHALPLALGVARRSGAAIQIVHVRSSPQPAYRPGELYYGSDLDTFPSHRQQAYLEGLARRLAKVTSVPVTPTYLQGKSIAEALHESASDGTDLVVMATHGRGPVSRFFFGGVADALMRRLTIPVLFTRGYNSPADLTGDPRAQHVLIALNGAEYAEQVLDRAIALGSLSDADYTLLRVISTMDNSTAYLNGLAPQPLVVKQQVRALSYLRSVARRLGDRTSRVRPRIVLDDHSIAKAILRFAQIHDADTIALATRGRGGLARLFQGSVVDQVVQHASVPVLVYRPESDQEGRATP